jgi:hypothetical protein
LRAPVFNAFGVIPQFPALADKLLAETARLAAKLREAYNSLRGSAADREVPGDLTRRILLEALLEVLKRSLKKGEKLGRGSVNDLMAC